MIYYHAKYLIPISNSYFYHAENYALISYSYHFMLDPYTVNLTGFLYLSQLYYNREFNYPTPSCAGFTYN
jgi:hypothetical protein